MKKKVLCIEDDPTIQTLVEAALPDFEVVSAPSLKIAGDAIQEGDYSAFIIDIQLPDGDGLRFLTQLFKQSKWRKTPVLVLTDHAEISNKVLAFSLGAEDFLAKPFDPIELNARVTAKVKKASAEQDEAQNRRVGDLLIDFLRQKAFRVSGGKERDLNLTSIELKILSLFTRRLEQVYSRRQIMDQVWGETFITDRTIDSHVAHLRQKLEESTVEIETAKNFGYRVVLKK